MVYPFGNLNGGFRFVGIPLVKSVIPTRIIGMPLDRHVPYPVFSVIAPPHPQSEIAEATCIQPHHGTSTRMMLPIRQLRGHIYAPSPQQIRCVKEGESQPSSAVTYLPVRGKPLPVSISERIPSLYLAMYSLSSFLWAFFVSLSSISAFAFRNCVIYPVPGPVSRISSPPHPTSYQRGFPLRRLLSLQAFVGAKIIVARNQPVNIGLPGFPRLQPAQGFIPVSDSSLKPFR